MLPAPLTRRLTTALRTARRVATARDVVSETVELHSTAGYRIAARIVRPRGEGRLPGVVVSPAIGEGVAALTSSTAVIDATEIAALGFVVLVHDPAGRGESWGEEDFGGPEHQDDLRIAIRTLATHPACDGTIGVLALSFGIVAAAAALARWPELPVRWLLDWEGPSDREIITAGGTRMAPAAGHALDDEGWWGPREPVRHVGRLRCAYVRLQAFPDHAQPGELRHAARLLHAAASRPAADVQINDHPRGEVPLRPTWLPGGPWSANRALLLALGSLRRRPSPARVPDSVKTP